MFALVVFISSEEITGRHCLTMNALLHSSWFAVCSYYHGKELLHCQPKSSFTCSLPRKSGMHAVLADRTKFCSVAALCFNNVFATSRFSKCYFLQPSFNPQSGQEPESSVFSILHPVSFVSFDLQAKAF